MPTISIQNQIDEVTVIGLGLSNWLARARAKKINRPETEIDRKQQRLEVLRAVIRTLESLPKGTRCHHD